MSWLSKYAFNPIRAMLERQSTSQNPITSAAGAAGLEAMQNVGQVANTAIATAVTSNSAVGLASPIVKSLEDGLASIVDATLVASLGEVPVVGAVLTPEAVAAANLALAFLEQHAATYLASLFHHAKAQNVVTPSAVKPVI